MPSQTATQVTPQLEPPPQLPPPIRELRPSRRSTVKVIDPGGQVEAEPATLIEASRLAKALKEESQPEPIAEITDENLHEYAEGAEVILLEGEPAAPAPRLAEADPPAAAPTSDAASADPGDEDYWRNGALDLRMGWRRTMDQVADLELEAAALRQEFYAEEDTYIRDGQIKPAWDRTLERLGQLRDRAQRYERELEVFVQEGQRLGVRQGWLNEGWELEPTSEERSRVEKFTAHRAIDPPTGVEVKDP